MQLELENKVAIVTGGSKGIGRATALGFLAEGASVLICARGPEALDETIALSHSLAQGSGRIVGMQADLTQADAIKNVVARCLKEFGRIDILVNNAGSARPGPFLEISDEDWTEDWTLKFFGYVRMARGFSTHAAAKQRRYCECYWNGWPAAHGQLHGRWRGQCCAESFYKSPGRRGCEAWRTSSRHQPWPDFNRTAPKVCLHVQSGKWEP